jgi:hypothetical protein
VAIVVKDEIELLSAVLQLRNCIMLVAVDGSDSFWKMLLQELL